MKGSSQQVVVNTFEEKLDSGQQKVRILNIAASHHIHRSPYWATSLYEFNGWKGSGDQEEAGRLRKSVHRKGSEDVLVCFTLLDCTLSREVMKLSCL